MSIILGHYLTDDCKITKLKDHSTANTTAITSDELDMAGYEGVLFLTSYGTAAANNTVTVYAGDTSSATAATTTTCASGTSDEDMIIDLFRPGYRYLTFVAARGTSSTLESMWAIQYGSVKAPVTNDVSGTTNLAQASGVTLA
jgi:hypothetical protein